MESLTNERLLELAARTIDWTDNNARRDPERAVMAQALRLRSALAPDSLAARTLGAVPIRCRIDSVDFLESSQRYDVVFTPLYAKKRDQEPVQEHATSDRVDTAAREHVEAAVQNLHPGDEAIVYKVTEDVGDGRKYRHFTWIDVIGKAGVR